MARIRRFCFIAVVVAFVLTLGAVPLYGAPRTHVRPIAASASKHIRRKPAFNFIHARFPEFRGVKGPDGPLAIQNRIADNLGMLRIREDWMIPMLVVSGRMIPIKSKSQLLTVDARLEDRYRYASPETAHYIEALPGRLPGVRLMVTSLVRSEEYQKFLATKWIKNAKGKRVYNKKFAPNAALCEKNGTAHCSIHITGFGFDLSTRGLKRSQILRIGMLFDKDQAAGRINAIYEPHQNHFHIFVIPRR